MPARAGRRSVRRSPAPLNGWSSARCAVRANWSLSNPKLEPAGWFFEYRNGHYPDTDDTAMVLMALARTGHAANADARPAAERGLRWLLGMQNKDGGWAAFDRDINRQVLTQVPFADHNAMLDPSCPDITARVLEALGDYGSTPTIRRWRGPCVPGADAGTRRRLAGHLRMVGGRSRSRPALRGPGP